MSETIRITDEVAEVLHELGGTFDDPDDVIRKVLDEAGYTVPETRNQEWESDELRNYFNSTSSNKQRLFLEAIVSYNSEWVPKEYVLNYYEENAINPDPHTLDGVQSGMTRRCGTKEKFWESRFKDGERKLRILPQYQEVVMQYWE